MHLSTYRNFDLLITRSGNQYRAFVVNAPGGEASATFSLPFSPDEITHLQSLDGVRRGANDSKEAGSPLDLSTLGRTLFETLFQEKIRAVLMDSLATTTEDHAGLRVRLRFEDEAADLASLPWEILYDHNQEHFIALDEVSPIVRYLSLPRSRSALLVEPPLRVLAVLSSPADLPELDMEQEWRTVQQSLNTLIGEGKFELERLVQPTLAALQARLLGDPVHILHFVGHGIFDEGTQLGSLVLEDDQGQAQLVHGEQMAVILRNHPSLRLVYLNACEGALASGQSVFTGVAQILVREGVPAVVAMQAEISDQGAIELAFTFYTALATGRPVDAALTQARVALSAAQNQEWAIPVLFSRSPDNRLFDIREMLPSPDCPYPGLRPFTEDQQDVFFGRDEQIADAVERLRQHPFLTVIGPSGSGKSSLVNAGIIPALRRSRRFGPGPWTVQTIRPCDRPLAALAETLGSSPDALSSIQLSERTLLFVDQFEELFTVTDAREAQTFLEALQTLMDRPNLFILLTVRADFYPDLMASPLWRAIQANRLELPPLGDDELWAAIVEPAARVGVTVDEALAVQLIADASGQSGVLPLVQETLLLLWEKVERRALKLAVYRQMAEGDRSGIQVAIDRRATITYGNLSPAGQVVARRIFLRLIQFGEGRADTRRQQTVADLRAGGDDPATFAETLDVLVESRLLTTGGAEGSARQVDISHEALIGGWRLLQEWIQEMREAESTRRQLEAKAVAWMATDKRGGLLDEYELQEVEQWLNSPNAQDLGKDPDLLSLVDASRAALNRAKLLRIGVLAVIALLILGGVSTYAFVQNRAAQEQRRLNEQIQAQNTEIQNQLQLSRSREVAATARTQLDEGRSLTAMLLSIAAINHITDTVEANITLRSALEAWRGVAEIPAHTSRAFVTFSGNGQYLASADESGLVRVWQIVGERRVIDLTGHTDRLTGLAFAPDSSFLLTTGRDGSARVWDPSTGDLLYPPIYHSGNPNDSQEIKSADLNQDDATVLVTRGVDNVRVWDLTTGQPLDPEPFTTGADLRSVAVSPTGEFMAAASADGLASFWQISSRINVRLPGSDITSFSNDGLYWATVSGPTLYLWDLVNGLVEVSIPDREMSANISTLVFSKDGKLLAIGGQDGAIRLWDLRNLGQPARTLRGHTEQITSLRFSPDNRYLSSSSLDDTARIWRVETSEQEILLTGHQAQVWSVDFSLDSRQIATSDAEGTIRLWQVQVGGDVARLEMADAPASDLALMDSEGAGVALAGDGTAQIWRSDIPRVDANLVAPAESEGEFSPQITAIATHPQDATLALGTAEGDLLLLQMGSGELLDQQMAHTNGVSRLLAPPWPGGDLLTAGNDGFIRRWHTQFDGNTKTDEWMAHPGGVTDLAVVGELVASTGYDGRIRLWDGATGQISVTLGLTSTATLTAAPDVDAELSPALAVALSADGRLVAGAGRGPGIFVWDITTPDAPPTLIPFSAAVRTLAFSPDGNTLASGDENGQLRLWTLATGRAVQVGKRSTSWIVRTVFSPDGSRLFSLDQAGNAHVWPVSTVDLVNLACARAIRDLTETERAEYLPFLSEDLPTCDDLEATDWVASRALDPPRRTPMYNIGGPLSAAEPPRIYYFDSLSGTQVVSGDEITLRWRAENASAVYIEIDGERQGVTSPNEMAFTVDGDTLFRLVVENATGERSQSLHVQVE